MGVDEEIAEAVHKHGWQLISINDNNPPFQYSIGFMPQHPEVIVFGLESKVASNVLNTVGRRVKENEVFEHKGIYEIEAEPNRIAIRRVHATQVPLHFGCAMGFCRISNLGDVQAVQLFWPDNHGRIRCRL
jgi:Domain of unknown function (DUF4262)